MSTVRNAVTIWLMSCEDVERMLKAKYGNKLASVSHRQSRTADDELTRMQSVLRNHEVHVPKE